MTEPALPKPGLRTRIAPTPSGYLHFGNGINFSATWQLAQAHKGHVLLRIDDLDEERTRPEYIDDIFRTLHWLGIEWHEGPTGPDDFHRHWSQHARLRDQWALLERLRAVAPLYACDCSRKMIADAAPDGRYPGTCKGLGKVLDNDAHAWRLDVSQAAEVVFEELGQGQRAVYLGALIGDPVLRQRAAGNAPVRPSYQIASLADDVHFRIDTIVRGEDLLPSTTLQVHLAGLLGLTAFTGAAFLHHPLSTDANGQRLSKSAGATALKTWRESGRSPDAIHTAARGLLTARGLLPIAG
ncbi:MAG: hypothetical protein IPG74_06840 [Flavobacteriales bacterium]|nr:hypothetical protein [Flavobacteriales bacterium]